MIYILKYLLLMDIPLLKCFIFANSCFRLVAHENKRRDDGVIAFILPWLRQIALFLTAPALALKHQKVLFVLPLVVGSHIGSTEQNKHVQYRAQILHVLADPARAISGVRYSQISRKSTSRARTQTNIKPKHFQLFNNTHGCQFQSDFWLN